MPTVDASVRVTRRGRIWSPSVFTRLCAAPKLTRVRFLEHPGAGGAGCVRGAGRGALSCPATRRWGGRGARRARRAGTPRSRACCAAVAARAPAAAPPASPTVAAAGAAAVAAGAVAAAAGAVARSSRT